MKPTLGYYRVLRGQNNLWCRLILHRKAVNTLDAFEHEKGVVGVCGRAQYSILANFISILNF